MATAKFLDNKQLVHIASEVVVLLGITFYFSSKNKALLGHIEELSQRIEEQEDKLQKLENSLQDANNNTVQNFTGLGTNLNILANRLEELSRKVNGKVPKSILKKATHATRESQATHANPPLAKVEKAENVNKVKNVNKPVKPEEPKEIHTSPIEIISEEESQPEPQVEFSEPENEPQNEDDLDISDAEMDDIIENEISEMENNVKL